MEKQEYVNRLREFLKTRKMSLEHYYYSNAVMMRSTCGFTLTDFELENPFLTGEDIKKLLQCKDSRIPEYYAYAMSKVIRLYEQQKTISKDEIRATIEEKMDEVITKKDIREVINEKMDSKETISRKDIQEVVNGELKKQDLSRKEIQEIVEEKLEKKSSFKVFITGISRKISDLLNGFAVVKEEKTGRAHLYHHDAATSTLKGEQVIPNNQLKVDSGYYVNYEEYIDHMLDEITEKYPNPEEIRFVRDDGQERSLKEVLEEAFLILKRQGALRFGKELKGKKIDSYQDLVELRLKETEEFAGEPLKVGIYVRRDVLTRFFAKYQAKVTMMEEENEKRNQK